MIRGEIWWAQLPEGRGSEPKKFRPVLVVQADFANRSNLQTVICASITSNLELAHAPGNLLLETRDSKLEKTSVVNFSQLSTVDREYFTEYVAVLPNNLFAEIDAGLKTLLGIT